MISNYLIKKFLIRILDKILLKNIFLLSKIINFNKKNKNIQILKLSKKNLTIYNNYRYKIKIPLTATGIKPLLFLKKKSFNNFSKNFFERCSRRKNTWQIN